MSIKGSRNRDTDKPAWDACPLWANIDAKKVKNTRIFNENKHLIEGSNVKIIKRYDAEDDNMVEELVKEGIKVFATRIQRRFYIGYNRASIIRNRVNKELGIEY